MPINGAINPPTPKTSRFLVSALLADTGLYRTPFNARGIKKMIMIALKITALRMALWDDPSRMIFKTDNGPVPD